MAAPKAPLLDGGGNESKQVTLESEIFGAELKPHLVHETVRAELNARRAGTRGAKSRGLVSGGRGKPWRQKGTGRARAGTIRAPQFTGGGLAFPPTARSFELKVNRKARRSALRGALSSHAANGTFRVHQDAHKTQVRQAVEELFGVKVERVNISHVKPKPKRRGLHRGKKPGWKKAIVQVREGDTIEIFEGAQV